MSSSALSLSICQCIRILHTALRLVFNFCLIYLPSSALYKALCFLTLLINVLLDCVGRELKRQQDAVKDRSVTIAILNNLSLNCGGHLPDIYLFKPTKIGLYLTFKLHLYFSCRIIFMKWSTNHLFYSCFFTLSRDSYGRLH